MFVVYLTENLMGDFPRANPAWKTDIALCRELEIIFAKAVTGNTQEDGHKSP